MTTKSKVAGAFMGLAIGDALGAPVEGMKRGSFEPVSEMLEGGLHALPKGAWTNVTAMAICLAQSLLAKHDLDVYDFMERLNRWVSAGENTSTGICIGLDEYTEGVISNYQQTGSIELNLLIEPSAGNFALVRTAPIACIHWDNLDTVASISRQQSFLTQSSEISASACEYLGLVLSHLIAGRGWDFIRNMPIKNDWSQEIKGIADFDWENKNVEHLGASKFATGALEIAFWCIHNSKNFEDALTLAVNFGGASGSVGAITGQIAGAIYGLEAIPIRWFDDLLKVEHLTDIAMQMVELSRSD